MRRGADMRALGRDVGKIGAGGDCLDSGQRLRLFGIDRYDPGMSMRAALDAAPQHTRHCHIGAEIGPARDFVDAVGADRPGADYPKCGLVEIAHVHPPVVPREAGHGTTDHGGRFSGHSLGHEWAPRTRALIFIPPNTLECTQSAIPVGGGSSRRARGTHDVRGVGFCQ